MKPEDMTTQECMDHPLWPIFKEWLIDNGHWSRGWSFMVDYRTVYQDALPEDYRWRSYWCCFMAGAEAGKASKKEVY